MTVKTGAHDKLIQKVDTALRAQVQTKVARLDALVAELASNKTEGDHARALAGLTNLEAEVRALTESTRGHLGDLKSNVSNLQAAGQDLQNHI